MGVIPQRVALTCCSRTVVVFDYPELTVHRYGTAEFADAVRDRAGWSRIRIRCKSGRHLHERVLRAASIYAAVERAIGVAPVTMVASYSRRDVQSAESRGDIDHCKASAARRGTVPQIAIPLDSI